MKKSLIVLNLSGEPDPADYVREGVALGVYKPNELKAAIKKLLQNDLDFTKARNKYIEKYLFKMDGKSSNRVLKIIQDQLKK